MCYMGVVLYVLNLIYSTAVKDAAANSVDTAGCTTNCTSGGEACYSCPGHTVTLACADHHLVTGTAAVAFRPTQDSCCPQEQDSCFSHSVTTPFWSAVNPQGVPRFLEECSWKRNMCQVNVGVSETAFIECALTATPVYLIIEGFNCVRDDSVHKLSANVSAMEININVDPAGGEGYITSPGYRASYRELLHTFSNNKFLSVKLRTSSVYSITIETVSMDMPACGSDGYEPSRDHVRVKSILNDNVDEHWCGDTPYYLATDESELQIGLGLGTDRLHYKKGFALRYTVTPRRETTTVVSPSTVQTTGEADDKGPDRKLSSNTTIILVAICSSIFVLVTVLVSLTIVLTARCCNNRAQARSGLYSPTVHYDSSLGVGV